MFFISSFMKCPVCEKNKFKSIFLMKEVARWNKMKFSLFRCVNCKLIRPNPLPYDDSSKFSIYNSNENIRFYDARNNKICFDSLEYKDYFKHFAHYTNFVKKYNIKGRHLDIGCGAGHIIDLFLGLNFDSEGLEISNKLFHALKLRYKVHNVELKKLKSKYNVITLSHVLEHIVDPFIFVREINKHLYNKGFVILSIPYIKGIIPQLLRTKWYGLGHGQHINLFSKENLKILFEKNGFKILEFNIKILDYTYKNFPPFLNKSILLLSNIIEKLNLGDNLYMVAIKSKELK